MWLSAHSLVVVVSPAAHLTPEPADGSAGRHRGNACFLRRAVDGQLDEDTDELIDGESVSRRKVMGCCRRPAQALYVRLVHTTWKVATVWIVPRNSTIVCCIWSTAFHPCRMPPTWQDQPAQPLYPWHGHPRYAVVAWPIHMTQTAE